MISGVEVEEIPGFQPGKKFSIPNLKVH